MRNWLNEFSKSKRSTSKISFEEFEGQMNEFKNFVKVNESMTFVLAVYCMLRGKKSYVKIADLLEETEPHIHNDFVIAQVEALFVGGWFLYGDEGPFSGCDQIYLTHNAELALKSSNAKAIPRKTTKKEDAKMMALYARAVSFRNKNISLREWSKYVSSVLNEVQLPFIQYLKSKKLRKNEYNMALYIGLLSFFEQSKIELYHILNLFCDNPLDYARKKQELSSSEHPLYEKEVLEKVKRDNGATKIGAHGAWISNQSSKQTATPSIDLKNKTLEWNKFEKIKPKKLLYNSGILEQIELLKKVLNPSNFKKFIKQARKNGDYAGAIILLSGGPGTGKTELAKQLALETHRDLLTFQVAQQRNMYLGESEKAIQSVFDDYKRVSKRMDNSPILFFNEADSVFGNRSNHQSSVSQTENTIQTILLNELETFEGILICTTNVPDKFDEAFNRRFLMHIVIDNPDEQIRKELLLQIFPTISLNEAKRMAYEYTFTAAELGKFKKQWDLQKITGMQKGNIETNLSSFLSQLKITQKTNPIGYAA
jgi:hypothetical protein